MLELIATPHIVNLYNAEFVIYLYFSSNSYTPLTLIT